MQVKDLKLTVTPDFNMAEIPRFVDTFKKGMFRAGGSLAKGFSRAYDAVGKTSMYAQYIISSLQGIYETLTKSNRTIEKGFNLATNTLRKTSRATGLTEGQIMSVTHGFAGIGVDENETAEMLRAFALQQQITNPYSQDPANLGDKFYSALTELSQIDDRIARNALSQQYFNMSAEKGSIIDLMINEVEKAKAGTRNYEKFTKDPELVTRASKSAGKHADKMVAQNLDFQKHALVDSYIRNQHFVLPYEQKKLQDMELSALNDKALTLEGITASIKSYTDIQKAYTHVVTKFSAKILEIIDKLGGMDVILNNVVKSLDFFIDKLSIIIDVISGFKGYQREKNVEQPFIAGQTVKQSIESDVNYQNALKNFLSTHEKMENYLKIDKKTGVKRFDLKKWNSDLNWRTISYKELLGGNDSFGGRRKLILTQIALSDAYNQARKDYKKQKKEYDKSQENNPKEGGDKPSSINQETQQNRQNDQTWPGNQPK